MLLGRSATKKRQAASPATVKDALEYKARMKGQRLQVDCWMQQSSWCTWCALSVMSQRTCVSLRMREWSAIGLSEFP
eukprot:4199005-Amphidinium_carterae.2